jgi:hypothetical protein
MAVGCGLAMIGTLRIEDREKVSSKVNLESRGRLVEVRSSVEVAGRAGPGIEGGSCQTLP